MLQSKCKSEKVYLCSYFLFLSSFLCPKCIFTAKHFPPSRSMQPRKFVIQLNIPNSLDTPFPAPIVSTCLSNCPRAKLPTPLPCSTSQITLLCNYHELTPCLGPLVTWEHGMDKASGCKSRIWILCRDVGIWLPLDFQIGPSWDLASNMCLVVISTNTEAKHPRL